MFIGSSKTYYHIDVQLFDDLTGQDSYNLGCNGMFYLETHYILEQLLNCNHGLNDLKIFQQIRTPHLIKKQNLHSVRSKYFMDWKRMVMGLSYFWERRRYGQVYYHVLSFVENILGLGMLRQIFDYHTESRTPLLKSIKSQNGFYSLDQRAIDEKNQKVKKKAIRNFQPFVPSPDHRPSTQIEIKKLDLEEMNIQLDLASIQFYQIGPIKLDPKFYYNRGHFNEKGAKQCTQLIASSFLDLIDKEK